MPLKQTRDEFWIGPGKACAMPVDQGLGEGTEVGKKCRLVGCRRVLAVDGSQGPRATLLHTERARGSS